MKTSGGPRPGVCVVFGDSSPCGRLAVLSFPPPPLRKKRPQDVVGLGALLWRLAGGHLKTAALGETHNDHRLLPEFADAKLKKTYEKCPGGVVPLIARIGGRDRIN